jgi:zeaxanthin epoxidase
MVGGLVSSTALHSAATGCSTRAPESYDLSWRRAAAGAPSLLTSSQTWGLKAEGLENSRRQRQRHNRVCVARTQTVEEESVKIGRPSSDVSSSPSKGDLVPGKKPLRILVAGGGIGGLVLALAAKNRGLDVVVFERDLSAIRGEGQYRGPIQIQSNALGALEAVDKTAAEEILENGCVTGDRINGLVDGISGQWYCKFDTFTPAAERGLPVTRVISRVKLQEILSRAVGEEIIQNGSNVVDYVDDGEKVKVILEDGRTYEGDVLVGADGIRSKVRGKLLGQKEAVYSDYTCYTGIADFVPADIETVGYRVFLGHKQYFVSSDVGQGRMQWYAFYNEPAGGVDAPGGRKARLMSLFGDWCDKVVDLLLATPEEQILRRDIYDRVPIMTWSKGRVTLLGDSAHAMQPNLGQGGCMAIEDGFQLALDLGKAAEKGSKSDIARVLKEYEGKRRIRVGVIHGLARMAAIMATTYKPYLGEGMGPLSFIKALKIPHPGRVGGRFFITIGMPTMLSWILGGNSFALEGRAPYCSLEDKADSNLKKWFWNDDALERATKAEWYLVPEGERMPATGNVTSSGKPLLRLCTSNNVPTIVGSAAPSDKSEVGGEFAVVDHPDSVAAQHVRFMFNDGALFVTDLDSKFGTWITSISGGRYQLSPKMPVRVRPEDVVEFGPKKEVCFKVKLRKSSSPAPSSPALPAALSV